jgi:hypothetical protein
MGQPDDMTLSTSDCRDAADIMSTLDMNEVSVETKRRLLEGAHN